MGKSWLVRAGALMVLLVEVLIGGAVLPARQTLADRLRRTTKEGHPRTDALGDPLPAGAVARLGSIRLWHEGARAVTFSADGTELTTVGVRRTSADSFVSTIRCWDAATGRLLRDTPFPNLHLTAWAATPDGKRLVLGVNDNKGRRIALWDVAKGQEIDGPAMKHIWPITYLAILRDGKTLASRDQTDNGFHIWDLATRKEIKRAEPNPPRKKHYTKNSIALSADGKRSAWYIKSYEDDEHKGPGRVDGEIIQVVEDGGKTLFQQNGPFKGLVHVAISADGRRLAWASDREPPRVIDVASKETILSAELDSGYCQSLAFSPDGKILVCNVGSWGHVMHLKLWNVDRRRALPSLLVSTYSQQWDPPLAFSSDGKTVAVSTQGATRVYDVPTGTERIRLPGHHAPIRDIHFTRDGKSLLSSDGAVVCRWRKADRDGYRPSPEIRSHPLPPSSGRLPHQADNGDDIVEKCRIDHALYSLDATRKVNESGLVLDISTPSPRKIVHLAVDDGAYSYWRGQISPDNRRVLLLREGRELESSRYEVFDAASGKRLAAWPTTRPLTSTFSADGSLFAWQDSDKGRLLQGDLRSGKQLQPFATDLAGKPVRHAFFAGSNMPNPARMHWRFDCLAFSSDNRRLAAAWNSTLAASLAPFENAGMQDKEPTTLYVWDTATGAETARIVFEPAMKGLHGFMRVPGTNMPHLTSLAFTRDGRTLAAGYLNDADVHLIEVASGRQRGVLRGHQGVVRALALSADGRHLVSGSEDTTLLVWDLGLSARAGEQPLTAKDSKQLWRDLASADAAVAFTAMQRLRRSPEQAVLLLSTQVEAAPAVEPEQISRWIRQLDSMDFEARDRATTELEQRAETAEPALRKALRDPPSLEVRRRLEHLLKGLPPRPLSPARLRPLRAVEVLEAIGDRAAQEHLEKLARGASQARLTREAKESLRRLNAVQPSR